MCGSQNPLTDLSIASTSSQIEIRNIRACTPDAEEYRSDNVRASLTVKHYTPADVNDDGTISISDVVSVVNGLLGIASKDFVFHAADMDQNGTITIVDVVAVVNTLLNGGINPTKIVSSNGIVENFRLTIGTNRLPIGGKGVYIVKMGKTIVKTNVK